MSSLCRKLWGLFYIDENDIREYTLKNKFNVVYDKCPCSGDSYRIQIREFVRNLSKKQKLNILENFERVRPKIKTEQKELNYCNICGELNYQKIKPKGDD
jgi:uncharacterized protein (TIGR00269 family)